MKKTQSVGTNQFVVSTKMSLTIPVNESVLPINNNVIEPNEQITPDCMYEIDARNAHFQMTLQTSNGIGSNQEKKIIFGKNQLRQLFESLQKIQDEINSFS